MNTSLAPSKIHWPGIVIWLCVAGLASFSAWQFDAIRDLQRSGGFEPPPSAHFESIADEMASPEESELIVEPRRIRDYSVIWTQPIHGSTGFGRGWPPPPPPAPRELADVVTVASLVFDSTGESLVYLRYEDDIPAVDLEEVRLGVGSKLKHPWDEHPYNASVVDISPEGVVITWRGEQHLVQP